MFEKKAVKAVYGTQINKKIEIILDLDEEIGLDTMYIIQIQHILF